MGGRTIIIYIITTVIAVSIGLVLVNIVKPGNSISDKTRTELVDGVIVITLLNIREEASKQKESGPLQALIDLVPQNIFSAATSNRNMLQVIFFAVFLRNWINFNPRGEGQDSKKFFFDGFK